MISVVILTFNEETNLQSCLESVSWSDDVLVFDSYSTDRTLEIAQAAGARTLQHPFKDFGSQREAARQMGEFKHPWVLVLDADERVEPTLRDEMLKAVCDSSGIDAFRMRRKDHFFGRWIKHSTLYPSWFVRLLRHEAVHYEPRSVHEYPNIDGATGELRGHLIHHSFNKGLGDWVDKHNRYAAFEAKETLKQVASSIDLAGAISFTDPVRRRRAIKGIFLKLPGRPLIRFFYTYFIRLSFIDGLPGLYYCLLLAYYEFLIVLKIKELRRRELGLPI